MKFLPKVFIVCIPWIIVIILSLKKKSGTKLPILPRNLIEWPASFLIDNSYFPNQLELVTLIELD